MKKHVPFLLSLLSIMGLLAWTASVRAQCLDNNATLVMPISNSAALDQSEYLHTVSMLGSPAYVTGQDGSANGAIHFNSAGQYATIAAAPEFEQMSDAFTMAAWVYPTSFQSYNAVLSKLYNTHRDIVFRYHSDGKFQVHFTNSSNSTTAVTTDNPVVSLNQWTHLAATWDGQTMKLFVNGQLEKESVLAYSPDFLPSGTIRIGTLDGGPERVIGYMDDVQMRSFATPENEVACLMNHSMELEQDLVLSLPLDDNSSTDVSSYANHGSITGSVAGPDEDRFGNSTGCMRFTSSGNVIVQNQSQYNGLASGFTISAWIKLSAVTGNRVIISKAGSARDIVLRVDNGKFTVHYYVGGYIWFTPVNATIVPNEWTNVACTWDGAIMRLYQDGEEIFSLDPATNPNFNASNNWNIGALNSSGSENFNGYIDDVKIWSRALSACEVTTNMYPAIDLVSEDNLILCEGQQLTVAASGMCTYEWLADNSTSDSFVIEADDYTVGDHELVVEAYDIHDNFYSDTVHFTVSLCTGIEESQNSKAMKLMPNPASHSVTVTASELTEVKLTDLSGRLIRSLVPANSDRAVLEVADLPSGIYLVTAIDAEGTVQVERLMKH